MPNYGIVVVRDEEMPEVDIMVINGFITVSWRFAKRLAEGGKYSRIDWEGQGWTENTIS